MSCLIRPRSLVVALSIGSAIVFSPLVRAGEVSPFDAAFRPIVDEYLKISQALSADTEKGIAAAAQAIVTQLTAFDRKLLVGAQAETWKKILDDAVIGAKAVAAAKDIAARRSAFKRLSRPLVRWAGLARPKDLQIVYCSMAEGSWLQAVGAIRNPYHGKEMLTCGETVPYTSQPTGNEETKAPAKVPHKR